MTPLDAFLLSRSPHLPKTVKDKDGNDVELLGVSSMLVDSPPWCPECICGPKLWVLLLTGDVVNYNPNPPSQP
jgi:hypothetical protein